jgi:hypothetical protein
MESSAQSGSAPARPRTESAEGGAADGGWLVFAGVMFLIGGAANILWGVAALDNKSYLPESGLLFSTLETWGWISIIWGLVMLATSLMVFARTPTGIALGILVAGVSAVFWLFALPVLPIWSLLIIGLDALIIYGLATQAQAVESR